MNDRLNQATANAGDAASMYTGDARDVDQSAKEGGDAAKHVDDAAWATGLAVKAPSAGDSVELIERRMNVRRASICRHLSDARDGVRRTAKSWPIVAVAGVVAVLAVGWVVATRMRRSPTERAARSLWEKARRSTEAARRHVHEATRPPSRAWTERVATGTGIAVALMRVLPQLRVFGGSVSHARR